MSLLASLRAPGTAPVHQVGIVVPDIEAAIAGQARLLGVDADSWRRASFDETSVAELTLRGSPAAFSMRLAFAGASPEIELIEPVSGESIYREWLEANGPGLHHLAIAVTSLEAATEAMASAGFGVLQAGRGFAPTGTGGFAYYDTVPALGYVLEAVELP